MIKQRPTVFLVITHGAHTRLILRSRVFPFLKAAGVRLVILAPPQAVPHLQTEFEDGEAVWVRPLTTRHRIGAGRMGVLRQLLLTDMQLNETIALKTALWGQQQPWQYHFFHPLNRVFSRSKFLDRLWLAMDRRLFPDTTNAAVFQEFRADLVVIFSLMHPEAIMAVRRARQEGVRTLYVVESWDNLSGKGQFRERPDRLIVWNEILRQEAVAFLDYCPSQVYVAGVPFHEVYAAQEVYASREAVCQRMRLDPARKTIFLAGTTASVLPEFDDLLDVLLQAQRDGRLVSPCQFVIRPHPQVYCGWDAGKGTEDDLRRYEAMSPYVVGDRPRLVSRTLKSETDPSDNLHLAELLYHSDVVVNAFSTVSIDAAAVDTPVVVTGFDGYARKDYYQSVLRYRDYTHQLKLLQTGGVRIAYSPAELVEYINAYVCDPSLDAPGRRRLAMEQCWRLDGQASERIVHCIVQYAQGRWDPEGFTKEVEACTESGLLFFDASRERHP